MARIGFPKDPTVKVFGGKRYKLYGSYAKKSEAQHRAFQLRIGGGNARVVYENTYYVVYYR